MSVAVAKNAARGVARTGLSAPRTSFVTSLPPRGRQVVTQRTNALFPSVADNASYADFVNLVTSTPEGLDPEASVAGVEAVLALVALSFVGTFIVAPKFKDSFKEEMAWADIYEELKNMSFQTIEAQDAKARAQRGALVVDVRMERNFNDGAINGSVNVPLYQPIQGMGLPANIRRAGFAFFGIYGSEPNEDFDTAALEKLPKGKEIIVTCSMGGSMETKPGVSKGFQSQSLKAVYRLKSLGFSKVSHLKGGVGEWKRQNDEPLLFPDEFTSTPAPAKKSMVSLFGKK